MRQNHRINAVCYPLRLEASGSTMRASRFSRLKTIDNSGECCGWRNMPLKRLPRLRLNPKVLLGAADI